MKKIIRETDEKLGIVQVTIADERWYMRPAKDPVTGLPTHLAVPSVTWIAGHYPKGIGFYKWLADRGWDEAQAVKQAAGNKGSKVHAAISAIIEGEEVRIDSKYLNPETGVFEELTLEECDAIKSFVDWQKATNPETIVQDVTIFSEKYNYAGTIDYICKIDGRVYLVDFKTSAEVWPEYELQVSAYKQPLQNAEFSIPGFVDVSDIQLAILQIGYRRNKAGYKWNEIEDQFPLFLAARQIWAKECDGQQPKKRDYPIVLSPKRKAPQVDEPKEQLPLPEDKYEAEAEPEPMPEAAPEPMPERPPRKKAKAAK
jgi:hypothetical protein